MGDGGGNGFERESEGEDGFGDDPIVKPPRSNCRILRWTPVILRPFGVDDGVMEVLPGIVLE
jgi:hypothetical protein